MAARRRRTRRGDNEVERLARIIHDGFRFHEKLGVGRLEAKPKTADQLHLPDTKTSTCIFGLR